MDATRSVIISYKVTNAVRWFDDHDELYWNVTGNDWPVPIDSAAASITFPANAAGNLRAQAFTGAYGSQEQDATVEVRNNTVLIETNNPLSMRGGLTADVYISKGVLTQPSKWHPGDVVSAQQSHCAAAAVGVRRDVLLLVDEGPRSQARHFGRAHVRAAERHDARRSRQL